MGHGPEGVHGLIRELSSVVWMNRICCNCEHCQG